MKTTALFLLLGLSLALAGCATRNPQALSAGQSEAEVLQLMGQPTARLPGPNGQTRLEFADGPYGRTTWMVDVNAAGKVLAWGQVMNHTAFNYVQLNYEGQDKDWLRYTLGRPADVIVLGWLGGSVWSYRYPTTECLWFQVTLNKDGTLRDGGGYGIDPRCDPGGGPGAGPGAGWR